MTRGIITITALAAFGCASFGIDRGTSVEPEDSLRGIYSVSSTNGPVGHVCPVYPQAALTAGHMSGFFIANADGKLVRIGRHLLLEIDGRPGVLNEYAYDDYTDLGIVALSGPSFPILYSLSDTMPAKGDKVRIRGFDVEAGFESKTVHAVVENVEHGYVYYKPHADRGSSGSCVLNDEDEVIAINVHGYHFPLKEGMGGGRLTVGPFARFPGSFEQDFSE